jgi:hypothetical protein
MKILDVVKSEITAKASYKWLLFLDCDTFPEKSLFISNYANQIKQSQSEAIYGGLQYQNIQPKMIKCFMGVAKKGNHNSFT